MTAAVQRTTIPNRRTILILLCGLAWAFMVYLPALRFGFAEIDDPLVILHTPFIRSLSFATVRMAFSTFDPENYIPLTFVSYQVDWLIGGGAPGIFHLTSIVLHLLNSVLAYAVFRSLGSNDRVAVTGALLFALHPLAASTVVWLTARKDLLSAAFTLASWLLFLRYARTRSRVDICLSVALFACALLSKATVALVPLAFFLVDRSMAPRTDARQVPLRTAVPFAILSVIFIIIARIGKSALLRHIPWGDILLMAPRTIVYYLRAFFVPLHLTYTAPAATPPSLTAPYLASAAIVGALGIFIISYRRRYACLFSALAFFLFAVAPSFANFSSSNIAYVGSLRYAYLPSLALCFIAAMGAHAIVARGRAARRAAPVVGIAVVLALSFLTYRQIRLWRDPQTLFADLERQYPFYAPAPTFLGHYQRRIGRLMDAATSYERALIVARNDREKLYQNLGDTYADLGRTDLALDAYDRATRVDARFLAPYAARGAIALQKRDIDRAAENFEAILAIDPHNASALTNMGIVEGLRGHRDREIDWYRRALEVDPEFEAARANLERDMRNS